MLFQLRARVDDLQREAHRPGAAPGALRLAGAGLEIEPAHVIALAAQQRGGAGRVHAAGEAEYDHLAHLPALPMYMASAAMSAGDTPDILEARPKLSGRSAASFCLASVRRPGTFS